MFRRLPQKAEDLYGSQVEVLQVWFWFANRGQRDHDVKVHTGEGKKIASPVGWTAVLHIL